MTVFYALFVCEMRFSVSCEAMAQRRPYRRLSVDERWALIRAHEDGEDYHRVADQLQIRHGTAWSVIARYMRTGQVATRPRGGRRPAKLDNESIDLLVMCIEETPQLTLNQLNSILRDTWPEKQHVSISTVSRSLHGALISLKKVVPQPAERNSAEVKAARRAYANWRMQLNPGTRIVYVDETGYNSYTMRTRGRAPVGERAVRTVCGSKGANTSVIAAISDQYADGVLYYEIVKGGVNREKFASFMQSLSAVIGEDEEVKIVMDNAPCHQNVEQMVSITDNQEVVKLPPWSPFLNPIENCFSVMKAAAKRRMALEQPRLNNREAATAAGFTVKEWRDELLRQAIVFSMSAVTQEKVANEYQFANWHVPACAAGESMFV